MRQEKTHPTWWQLYLLGLGMVGLLVLGASAPLSERGHQAAAIGTLLLVCGLVELWLRANAPALLHISKQILAQTSRRQVVQEARDIEHQPVLVSWRQAQEEEAQPQLEGALACREPES